MYLKRKISTIIQKRLKLPQKTTLFSDIRKAPHIPLSSIILSFCLMPFLNVKSMLMLDCFNRLESVKQLFSSYIRKRKMVCSDSTLQRIARWLSQRETEQFLLSLLPLYRKQNLTTHQLVPNAPQRRISIIDGSYMGTHWVLTSVIVGAGELRYPFTVVGLPGRGYELPYAKELIQRIPSLLGSEKPDLLLYDSLGFNAPLFHAARENGMHILIKSSGSGFRDVLKDAQLLFEKGDQTMFTTSSGFDSSRLCSWSIEMTSDTFAGYPVTIAHLVEEYSKRGNHPHEEAWIITTDFSLSPEELREAAHVRWSIENDCFKKLSALSGTKRFHFKEQKPFLAMLRLFCFSVTAFELALYMIKQNPQDYQSFRGGMKETTATLFIRFFALLEDGVFSS